MGTTMVAASFPGIGSSIANIGDSRAYLIGKDSIKQLTEDQTYVHFLVETGKDHARAGLDPPRAHVFMNASGSILPFP
jgi:protein phosphatase